MRVKTGRTWVDQGPVVGETLPPVPEQQRSQLRFEAKLARQTSVPCVGCGGSVIGTGLLCPACGHLPKEGSDAKD